MQNSHDFIKIGISFTSALVAMLISSGSYSNREKSWQNDHEKISEFLETRMKTTNSTQTERLAWHLLATSKRFGMDVALILSIIDVESSFKIDAVSSQGAIGLMQLQPNTARFIAERVRFNYQGKSDLFDPFKNISLGVAYLSWLKDIYHGQMDLYLSAYNAGPSRVDEYREQSENGNVAESFSLTRDYVLKVREGFFALRREQLARLALF